VEGKSVQEELGVAAHDGLQERIPVGWLLGDRLAKGKGVAACVGTCQVEVVSCDGGWYLAER